MIHYNHIFFIINVSLSLAKRLSDAIAIQFVVHFIAFDEKSLDMRDETQKQFHEEKKLKNFMRETFFLAAAFTKA